MKGVTKKITLTLFTITTLTFLSLVCYAAIEEGTSGNGILGLLAFVFSKLFYILRFPTHTLFIDYFSSAVLFNIGLVINIIFWTTIIQLGTYYFKR